MAVHIRLSRWGSKKRPFYRVVAADVRTPRDGKFLDIVGTYDPSKENEAEKCTWKQDRLDYWLSKGAKPSETVAKLIAIAS